MTREPELIPVTRFNEDGGSGTYYWHLIDAQIVRSTHVKDLCKISNYYCIVVTPARQEDIPFIKKWGDNQYILPVNKISSAYFSKFYKQDTTNVSLKKIQLAKWSKNGKYSIIKRVEP